MSITVCTISATLTDLGGNQPPSNMANIVATLFVKNETSFMHGNTLVMPFEQSAVFDNTGSVSLPVIETTTPGVALEIYVTLKEGKSTRTILFEPAVIPSQSTVNLQNLSKVRNAVW